MVEVRLCDLVDDKVCFLNDKATYATSRLSGHYDGEISTQTVGWCLEGNEEPTRLSEEVDIKYLIFIF